MPAFKFKVMMAYLEGVKQGTSVLFPRSERAWPTQGAEAQSCALSDAWLKAALSIGLMRKAPSTWIEAIVRSASSGETSSAMLARPKTWM
jgi:hypothetical protein